MSLITIIQSCFTIYNGMLTIAIISSWFKELSEFTIIQYILYYTDPYLSLFRRIIPPIGMIDISPIIAFFFLRIAESFVLSFCFSY